MSAPPPLAPPGARPWLRRVDGLLRLGGPLLVRVQAPSDTALGLLVRHLTPHPRFAGVFVDPTDLPVDHLAVVRPPAEGWDRRHRALLGRPLRCFLWARPEEHARLARQAPDLEARFTHVIDVPEQSPPSVIAALQACAGLPACWWRGPGLDAALRGADPERPAHRIDARQPYEPLLSAARRTPADAWLVLDTGGEPPALGRIRLALAEAGRNHRVLLLAPGRVAPGWVEIDATRLPLPLATTRLAAAGCVAPGTLAALLEQEPAALTLAERLRTGVHAAGSAAPDGGAALARLAVERRLPGLADPLGCAAALVDGTATDLQRAWASVAWRVPEMDLAPHVRRVLAERVQATAPQIDWAALWSPRALQALPHPGPTAEGLRYTEASLRTQSLGSQPLRTQSLRTQPLRTQPLRTQPLRTQRPAPAEWARLALLAHPLGLLDVAGCWADRAVAEPATLERPPPGLATVLADTGRAALDAGQLPLARRLLSAALHVAPERGGHAVATDLAEARHRAGRVEEAERLLRSTIQELRRLHGAEASQLISPLVRLGRVLEDLNRMHEAAAAFEEAQQLAARAGPADGVRVWRATAGHLMRRDRPDAAERVLREYVWPAVRALGPDTPLEAAVSRQIGRALEAQGRHREASLLTSGSAPLEQVRRRSAGRVVLRCSPRVRELAPLLERELRAAGMDMARDLSATPHLPTLNAELRGAGLCVVALEPHESWATTELRWLRGAQADNPALRLAVLHPTNTPPPVGWRGQAVAADWGHLRVGDPATFRELADALLDAARPLQPSAAPAPGAAARTAAGVPGRGGRETEIAWLLRHLRVSTTPVVALSASPGVGATSLICAGLIPAVARGLLDGEGQRWRVVHLTPSGPIRTVIAAALEPASVPVARARLAAQLDGALAASLAESLPAGQALLVVIDRVHLLGDAPWLTVAQRQEWLEGLRELAAGHPRLRLVVVRRPAGTLEGLEASLARAPTLSLAVSEPLVSAAIVRPTRLAGRELPAGLAARIAADAMALAPRSPLSAVAAVMQLLCRGSGPITAEDYARTGGVQRVFEVWADARLAQLAEPLHAGAVRLLIRLLRFDRGYAALSMPLSALDDEERALACDLLQVDLLREWEPLRPITSGPGIRVASSEPWITLAREELISEWPRLAEAGEAPRELARVLETAARSWKRLGTGPARAAMIDLLETVAPPSEVAQAFLRAERVEIVRAARRERWRLAGLAVASFGLVLGGVSSSVVAWRPEALPQRAASAQPTLICPAPSASPPERSTPIAPSLEGLAGREVPEGRAAQVERAVGSAGGVAQLQAEVAQLRAALTLEREELTARTRHLEALEAAIEPRLGSGLGPEGPLRVAEGVERLWTAAAACEER